MRLPRVFGTRVSDTRVTARSATVLTVSLLSAVALAACGGPTTVPTSLATASTSAKPSDAASLAPQSSAAPEPSVTSESPEPAPAPTSETPEPAPTVEPTNSGDDGALDPLWYPDWSPSGGKGEPAPWPGDWPRPRVVQPTNSGALDGKVVLIDPGHNLGNSTHTDEINREYWVGLTKICNTTGTETANGYPEATYTYDVAQRLASGLAELGATVVLTRNENSTESYGPCIQGRGLLGGQVGADVGVSIHADGGPAGGRGAFVYTPEELPGYTSARKAAESAQVAAAVLRGLADQGLQGSTYLQPNISPDSEQGTLNTASIPIVIVETLNMRNPDDAAIAESDEGRQRVADGLLAGIRRYLTG